MVIINIKGIIKNTLLGRGTKVRFLKATFALSVALSCLLPSSGYSEKDLRYQNIRQNMQQIFSYHVENKNLSERIIQRSFKIYLEQFDPDNLYLLKSEADPFLKLDGREIAKIERHYERDRFDEYVKLNDLIQSSISRHRRIRNEIYPELLVVDLTHFQEIEIPNGMSKSEQELKDKLKYKFMRMLAAREKRAGIAFTKQRREKILNLYEKKLRRLESPYYFTDEKGLQHDSETLEHYQVLHILKSMTKSLDAHSAYYSSEEAAELRTSLKKQFQGIGIVIKEGEDGIYISDLIAGGPAYSSGLIQPGDFLIAIDSFNIQDATFDEVLEHLRGDVGSSVELLVKSDKDAKPLKVKLKREKIVLHEERLSYTYEPYADGVIGKIVLPGFYDNGEGVNAERDLREAIQDLKERGPIYGLVIDMRQNSGGFLSQAVKVAGLFITKGIVVISKYSDGEIRYMRDLEGRNQYQGPLVLLTSKVSASAAEIVAQALQDYGVAIIVGDERTYGKGSMQYQTVTEEDAKSYFKVTVGRYYTISGRSTQIEGVKADIVVQTEFSPFNIGERYLEYPLSSDNLDFEAAFSEKSQYKNFQKKYQSLFQVEETEWKKMLPALKANSQKRLSKDANYQAFLRKVKAQQAGARIQIKKKRSAREDDYGVDDIQVKECVNIIKDMIYINHASTSR